MDCRIYVGSIHYSLGEEDIKLPFSTFGKINRIDMPREPGTMRSKGFCFIEFDDPDSAKQALQTMNGFELGGRKLKVGPPTSGGGVGSAPMAPMAPMMPGISPLLAGINPQLALLQAQQMQRANATVPQAPVKKTRIYVGSIFFNLTSDHVQRVFEAFGKVLSCQLIPNSETGLHKGYGFIEFEDEKSATEAIENMNGFELCGRPLKVGWAAHSLQAAAPSAPLPIPNPAAALALASANIAPQGGAAAVNAASLQQPTKCIRLANMIDPKDNDDAGLCDEVKEECEEIAPVHQVAVRGNYVFVNFKDVEGGKSGFAKLHGRWFGGKKIEAQYYDGAKADAGIFD
uniref:RRM domain-containing protein n=2 Tax=Lotharella oceanica TaxID=641309 RepID=A0A7S2TJH3_9EUKA|mmetsp:Transcript_17003/g.32272  ORF Transcript_17003/g.32272 Transcript_17003/m.32272 type:complete len:344 (+) Transcript_17003:841-1872(+)